MKGEILRSLVPVKFLMALAIRAANLPLDLLWDLYMYKLQIPSSVGGPCWGYKGVYESPLGCGGPVDQLYVLVLYCISHGIGIGFMGIMSVSLLLV